MSEYNAYTYLRHISTIMGQIMYFLFNVPLVQETGESSITLGHLLIFDFIVTLVLTFALNLPTRGITSWSKGK